MHESVSAKTMKMIGAVLGWFAVLMQLYLIIENRVLSVPGTIVQYFSYFTILTNIIVALCYTFLLFKSRQKDTTRWSAPHTQAAIAVYIFVVGIVYNLVLRFLWAPEGLQKITDELLHTVAPVWFLVYWVLFAPKTGLKWRYALDWLIFPLVYLIYVMIRGAITNIYPYPFLDAFNHGYPKVVMSSLVIMLLFLLLSLLLIGVGKKLPPVREQPEPVKG